MQRKNKFKKKKINKKLLRLMLNQTFTISNIPSREKGSFKLVKVYL